MKAKTLALGGLVVAGSGAAVLLRRRVAGGGAGPVRHVVTVAVPPEEVQAAWTGEGRLPGLPARVAPGTADEEANAPARQVEGVEGLRLRVALSPAPGERGTEVRVYAEGPAARSMSGRLREDLRHLKAVLEAGEWVTTEGQPSGRSPGQRRTTQKIGEALRRGGRG